MCVLWSRLYLEVPNTFVDGYCRNGVVTLQEVGLVAALFEAWPALLAHALSYRGPSNSGLSRDSDSEIRGAEVFLICSMPAQQRLEDRFPYIRSTWTRLFIEDIVEEDAVLSSPCLGLRHAGACVIPTAWDQRLGTRDGTALIDTRTPSRTVALQFFRLLFLH
jgi:hypothetical protein